MREIKFRAWDPIENRWIPENFLMIEADTGKAYCQRNSDSLIIQQFTGLLDKNGVKIFEGDIIRYNKKLFRGQKTGFIKYLVKWNKDRCCFSGVRKSGEVIANICENTDLLKRGIK